MSVTITPAGEADLPAIKMLLAESLDAMDDTERLDIEQAARNCREMLQDPAHHMLVARENDRILGFINFNTRKTILHPHESGLIDELIVSKSSRGTGIGRQLILAVIEECRKLGCSEVEVSTEKSNRNARRFYQACGFEEEGVLLEKQLED
jgi:ribosomal protein S18 acetylase RimI-like enzyme